jgi:hypothetical protein
MLPRLLGHTTLMMPNRYCQAVGCYDAIESHKLYSPVDRHRYTRSNSSLLMIINGFIGFAYSLSLSIGYIRSICLK